jgi:GxxExxY protein
VNHEIHGIHGNLLLPDEAFRIRGAIFEVYRTLGAGFLEAVYQEALAMEFETRQVPFAAMKSLTLNYKGRAMRQTYAPDFICFDQIIVELKAVREIAPEHRAQTFNYLRASGMKLAMLVNFGSTQGPRLSASRSDASVYFVVLSS